MAVCPGKFQAFPQPIPTNAQARENEGGLTKLEYAAIAALQGIVSKNREGKISATKAADQAWLYAKALFENTHNE